MVVVPDPDYLTRRGIAHELTCYRGRYVVRSADNHDALGAQPREFRSGFVRQTG